MIPGYYPAEQGRPYVPITTSVDVTSTAYLYSSPFFVGPCVQGALCVRATLGAGVTSVELKLQQALSSDPSDAWFDWALVDSANKTTVNNEYVSVVKSDVLRIDANTGSDPLGPIPFPLLLPYVRLAYKITGAGTANIGVLITRAHLTA
mgnify:CR=1 FL=1